MNLKKVFKKVMYACMSAAMIAVPTVPAYAAQSDVIDTTRTASLTIHKYDMTAAKKGGVDLDQFTSTGKQDTAAEEALKNYAIKGVEFSYLRVGDVKQQSEGGRVQMIYELPDALQQIIGLTNSDVAKTEGSKDYFTSQIINDKLAKALEDNTATKNKLEEYMGKDGIAMDLTDAKGVTRKDKLPLGLYLIVETKVPEDVTYTTNPWFVQLPMTDSEGDDWFYDIVCYPKNQTGVPTLEKKVRNNPDQANVVTSDPNGLAGFTGDRKEYTYADTQTATQGETLDYYLQSKLPHITSSSTYLTTYTFKDTLTKGITYGKDAVIAVYDSKDTVKNTNKNNADASGALAVWRSSDTDAKFRTDYGTDGNGNAVMTVSMTQSGLSEINKKYSDKYIVVYYTAKVNTDGSTVLGDEGNPNDVTLTWKRTSTDFYDVLKDECIVYAYGFNLTKKFSDDKGNAANVKFVVGNTSDHYFLKAGGSDGVYQVTGRVKTEDEATQFSPDANGKLIINGIEADTYELTETHSDAGYSVLKQPIIVKINTTTAKITPTQANVTGTKSKSGNDSVANDGNVQGTAIADNVSIVTTSANASVDDKNVTMATDDNSANAIVKMEVTNNKEFLLPQTGGKGIYLVTIAGVLIAAIGIISRKSKKENVSAD